MKSSKNDKDWQSND